MNKEKLVKFCLLPKIRIEVEKKIHPDKSQHIIYWEWCAANGVRPEPGSQPTNKIGKWRIFVDVITKDKSVRSYDVNDSDEAWQKLLDEAIIVGYRDDNIEAYECSISLLNGTAKFSVARMLADEGWVPELKVEYFDNDDLFKTCLRCGLASKNDIRSLIDMLTEAEKAFIDQAPVADLAPGP